jgi:hypothetical protein
VCVSKAGRLKVHSLRWLLINFEGEIAALIPEVPPHLSSIQCVFKRMMIMSNTDTRLPTYFHSLRSLKAFGCNWSCLGKSHSRDYSDTFADESLSSSISLSLSLSGHPHFFNQLSCGLDIISMAGEVSEPNSSQKSISINCLYLSIHSG